MKISRYSINQNRERVVGPTTRNFGKESKEEHVDNGNNNLQNLSQIGMRKTKNFEDE